MIFDYDISLFIGCDFVSGREAEIVRQSLQKTSSNRLPYGTFSLHY